MEFSNFVTGPLFRTSNGIWPGSPPLDLMGLRCTVQGPDVFIHGGDSSGASSADPCSLARRFFVGDYADFVAMPDKKFTPFFTRILNTSSSYSVSTVNGVRLVLGYEVGSGLWLEPRGNGSVRILSQEGHGVIVSGAETPGTTPYYYLRDGDFFQIGTSQPVCFRDPSRIVFRDGHRYGRKMSPEEVQIFRNAALMGTPLSFSRGGRPLAIITHHPQLGFYLRMTENRVPLTLIPPGEKRALYYSPSHASGKLIFLREGSIVQIGDEPPFIFRRPEGVAEPSAAFASYSSADASIPARFLDLIAHAMANPGDPYSFPGEDMRVTYEVGTRSLRINTFILDTWFYNVLVVLEDGHLEGGDISFGYGQECFIQLPGESPFYYSFDQVRSSVECLRRQHVGNQKRRKAQPPPPPPPKEKPEGGRMLFGALEVLGVKLRLGKNPTQNELKRAWQKLAFEYHPDRNPGNPTAEERFKVMDKAYDLALQILGYKR